MRLEYDANGLFVLMHAVRCRIFILESISYRPPTVVSSYTCVGAAVQAHGILRPRVIGELARLMGKPVGAFLDAPQYIQCTRRLSMNKTAELRGQSFNEGNFTTQWRASTLLASSRIGSYTSARSCFSLLTVRPAFMDADLGECRRPFVMMSHGRCQCYTGSASERRLAFVLHAMSHVEVESILSFPQLKLA